MLNEASCKFKDKEVFSCFKKENSDLNCVDGLYLIVGLRNYLFLRLSIKFLQDKDEALKGELEGRN